MKKFEIITLFPELFPGPLGVSIFKKSYKKFWNYDVHDLRNFGIGKQKIVDDTLFGGVPGMLIRPDVIENCMNALNFKGKKIFLSPKGQKLNQKKVEFLIENYENFLILCARYEGIDQRAIDFYDFEEISIGDYIISGGESAAFILMESMIRKITGVVGNSAVFDFETFVDNEISEARYTRPFEWNNIKVPEVLISGHHENILKYRKKNRKKID